MGKMIDIATAAGLLKVNVQRMRLLCRQRRIPGARLMGRVWMIPENFKVIEGTRGQKLLEAPEQRIIRRMERAIEQSHKIERYYDKLAKKHGLKRYPHGELPLGTPRGT